MPKTTHLRLLALLEESIFSRLLGRLVLGEEACLARLLHDTIIHTAQVHLSRCRDNISGVYPSQGDAIDFERAGDKENALVEVFEEDDTLTAEATSEEDDDGAGLERRANLGRANGLASLESQLAEFQFEF